MNEAQTHVKANESKSLKTLARPSRFQDPLLLKQVSNVATVIFV
jgi:hypothetical protein